jgi:hypothetical protein
MRAEVNHECADHPDPSDCPDGLITYVSRFREYGLVVHDGGRSVVTIEYCPWCGAALPASVRDRWFETIEGLGLDPWVAEVPDQYRDGTWIGDA